MLYPKEPSFDRGNVFQQIIDFAQVPTLEVLAPSAPRGHEEMPKRNPTIQELLSALKFYKSSSPFTQDPAASETIIKSMSRRDGSLRYVGAGLAAAKLRWEVPLRLDMPVVPTRRG